MEASQGFISIKGARVHNLKNIDVDIPRESLVVVTGVSGSGKSSLAFDTVYAEGQRRYVESLSSYARQFLGKMHKPEVDFISGIPPAIAIEQKVNTRNPRSTVGTSTEIYDYMRLLFARVGKTISPVSGNEVKRHSTDDVVSYIRKLRKATKVIILTPGKVPDKTSAVDYFNFLIKQGFVRIRTDEGIYRVDDESVEINKLPRDGFFIVVDRIVTNGDEEEFSRIADSVETAFTSGNGYCYLELPDKGKGKMIEFSNRFESDGIMFDEPSEHLFSFNNPLGACPVCEGYSKITGIDEELVIPDPNLSVFQDAIACWKGEKMKKWKERLINNASKFDFPIHKPWHSLTDEQKHLVWTGNRYFYGLNRFFDYLEEKKYKIQYRVMLSRYRGKTICPECHGSRLRKEAGYVKVGGMSISQLTILPVSQLARFFNNLKLTSREKEIAGRIIIEIRSRLSFLENVGLGYLTLNRLSSTLSGGESQRINLATSLGSSLVGSLYILDEPSIGLHPRDTQLLVEVLKHLRDIGNTVVVVEHEEEIIRAADSLIDVGPEAGRFGGHIVYHGPSGNIVKEGTLTGDYLSGIREIPIPGIRRKWNSFIEIRGARENNLKEIDARFPLNIIVSVTGVSGSGKSSLVSNILYPAVRKNLEPYGSKPGKFREIGGDIKSLTAVELIDQNPIGRSSRSNPVTYMKAFDEIRKLFADQQASKQAGYRSSHFSFNIDGGRCEECQGEGTIKVDMQFMADVELECEACHGKRYKKDILDVRYREKNIFDVLEMTVSQAIEFFSEDSDRTCLKIIKKLKPLVDVGLGYVKLGQSSSTLSGGESQRVKLAFFLSQEKSGEHTLFIFDEPTTGLHFHDINKLLASINALVENGNSVIIIEHNMEMIKSSDWVIDLGPEGGEAGGHIVFEGTPEDLANCKESYTGRFIKNKLKK